MTDRIPITSQIARALVDFICPEGACGSLPQTLHVEEYIDRELAFERGVPNDGTILVKADGRDAFELKEEGIISNLEYQKEFNFCPRTVTVICTSLTSPEGKTVETGCFEPPQLPCDNRVKMMISALFGEEELKSVSLTEDEQKRAKKLREAMGLNSPEKKENPSQKIPAVPSSGSFFTDRWQGWRLGGEAFVNHYEGPGGGSKLWIGYRQDRWDFRVAVQGEGIKLQENGYNFRLGASFEPLFHLLNHPLLLDPYINLPEIGFYHLFRKDTSGISFSPLGAGLMVHLNDNCSLYSGVKLRGAFTFEEKPRLGVEVPLGVSVHL